MFRWFESRLNPFPPQEPVEPPKTLIAFCLHYTRSAWPYIIVSTVLSATLAIIEVWLFGFMGSIVDWLSNANRETFLETEGWKLAGMAVLVLVIAPALDLVRQMLTQQTVMGNYRSVSLMTLCIFVLSGQAMGQAEGRYDPRLWSYDQANMALIPPPLSSPTAANREPQCQQIPRQVVVFGEDLPKGSIVINTSERRLYYVLGNGTAIKYTVGVGKEGFHWEGRDRISMKRYWPDWRPPAEMRRREALRGRVLPVRVKGGPNNPLGARALYLGNTLYRIHGTNEPWTVGQANSSGCIRMTNEDVIDLYDRVDIGAEVVVDGNR